MTYRGLSENTIILNVYRAHWVERVIRSDRYTPNLLITLPMKKFSTSIGSEIKFEIEFDVSLEKPAFISS